MLTTILRPLPEALRHRREQRRLLHISLLACVVGGMGAAAAFGLQAAIVLATNLFFYGSFSLIPSSPALHHLGIFVMLIPPLGGLIVGLLARYGSSAIRGHGIPEAMQTILLSRSRIEPRVAFFKPVATAISIGSGGPFGAEGPIIQTGGALGSLLGQALRLTTTERKVLLVAGAAAGMAATFGTPVAAAFLAIELLLFEFRARSFLPVALASAVATGLRWAVYGSAPLYPAALHTLTGLDLPIFAALGVCAGVLASVLSKAIYGIEEAFERLPIHWMWWPALGGLAVGIVGWFFPPALGVGAEHLQLMVAGRVTLGFFLSMLVCKSLAWSVSLGSGTSGGVLGPLLLMGGALGGTLACLAGPLLPVPPSIDLWVIVCMAAVFAGATRTPLTSVVFALELTHDTSALLPLLIACTVSDLVSLRLTRYSLMTEKIARRGIRIGHDYELDALGTHSVGQVMTAAVETVPASLPLRELFERFNGGHSQGRYQGYPVVDDAGRLTGMVTRSDLPDFPLPADLDWLVVADVMSPRSPVVAHPDESLRAAAERMLAAGVGRLPVVVPGVPDRLVGLLTRSDVLAALARRVEEEYQRERLLHLPTDRKAA